MSKPTIFFSHSSKDKDIILKIKNDLHKATGGVLNIFMSSDGQSIPLGTNWIHKIEEGLNEAKIMFIFITSNSIISNWIYFESGFAYSKNIEVIPVGLGIDISLLKPPLNMLQGFNITSGDSLNNFISVINKKFSYDFQENYTKKDFDLLLTGNDEFEEDLQDIFSSIEFEANEKYNDSDQLYDLNTYFSNIIKHLKTKEISFSQSDKCILVSGIRILLITEKDETARMKFIISSYNFKQSFSIFKELRQLLKDLEHTWFKFKLNNQHLYVTEEEKVSSIIFSSPDVFSFNENKNNEYSCGKINFCIQESSKRNDNTYLLRTWFKLNEISYDDFNKMILKLIECKIIYPIK